MHLVDLLVDRVELPGSSLLDGLLVRREHLELVEEAEVLEQARPGRARRLLPHNDGGHTLAAFDWRADRELPLAEHHATRRNDETSAMTRRVRERSEKSAVTELCLIMGDQNGAPR